MRCSSIVILLAGFVAMSNDVLAFSLTRMAVRQKYRVSRPHQSRAPSRLGVAIMPDMATEETGMVAGIDLTGVAKSGMGYKAMMNEAEDFPTAGEVSTYLGW